MAGLGATTMKLARLRGRWRDAAALVGQPASRPLGAQPAGTKLRAVTGFGSNPGDLAMFTHVPDDLPAGAALVVVLHGCGQSADGYDAGAGWSTLAERHGFALLYPQQSAGNNQNRCFNWFVPGDTRRDSGEASSIRQMIEHAVVEHGIDRARIFVTGLSAGGAMTAVMLATYPEIFAGGGIVAGLPYGAAGTVSEALGAMFEPAAREPAEWGDLVRQASLHRGAFPRVSIWHGSKDATVRPANAAALVRQWTNVHGLPETPTSRGSVEGHMREVWHDRGGRAVVESFTIAGMGHGTPLAVGEGAGMCGQAGPYLLDVGISSSHHMAAFWGLTQGAPVSASRGAIASRGVMVVSSDGVVAPPPSTPRRTERPQEHAAPEAPRHPGSFDVGGIINDALRAAGLLRR